jgi:hypothetical protein
MLKGLGQTKAFFFFDASSFKLIYSIMSSTFYKSLTAFPLITPKKKLEFSTMT